MDDTKQFIEKVHDTQAKDEHNRRAAGKSTPSSKLPGKQHAKNP
ncbi:DUF4023 domain-containing protein [Marinicrinis sediminis]|uniref:DUF4023 domain-containing protein n=1 Tax=Marinicrinis sediminis TaxID=1652465 RepID=A0ABW5R5H8_9BACL